MPDIDRYREIAAEYDVTLHFMQEWIWQVVW